MPLALDFRRRWQVLRNLPVKPLFIVPHKLVRLSPLLAALLFCAGCDRGGDDKITVYRIPKETPPAPPALNSAAAPAVHWTAPAAWEEQPASGFRKGSFKVKGPDGKTADVSVISFPEQAGGLLANVNRWRDQLKLPPIGNEAEVGTPMPVAGRDLFFVDLVSAQAITPDGAKSRILGGIFPLPGETWFFKMMGPDQLVEAQRNAFRQFLGSVHPEESGASISPMTADSGSTNAPTPPPIAPAAGAPLAYQLPAGWQEKPLSTMRLASFDAVAPNGKKADVSVVSLAGIAGGDLANVNRWRGQVKLPPIDEDTLAKSAEHVNANGHDFLVVDLAGGSQRILAAILDENERSWFIKMTGEDVAVAAQKSAFLDFLRSLKLPREMTKSE